MRSIEYVSQLSNRDTIKETMDWLMPYILARIHLHTIYQYAERLLSLWPALPALTITLSYQCAKVAICKSIDHGVST